MNRRKGFLIAAILISLIFVGRMVSPYAGYLLTGLLLAFIGFPLQKRLRKYMPETLSAGTIILITFFVAILPFGLVAAAVAGDASDVVRDVGTGIDLDLDLVDQRIEELTGQEVDLEAGIRNAVQRFGSSVAGSASSILSFASSVAIGLSLMLFIQFYGLKDGGRFVEWTKKFDLMPTDVQEKLYTQTGMTTRAVIKGHVLVAIAQGLIAGLGLLVTGVPNFVFWTFVMIILGFIPLIGTLFVWLPAAAWLFLNGNVNSAVILLVWGFIVVGAVDNFLRPFLVDESADLHPLFVILGVIGGIGVFGVIGLFLGPVIFGIAKTLLEIYIQEYDRL